MLTVFGQLVASEADGMGYITYVFKTLEPNAPFGHKYIMLTRVRNWEHRNLEIGEIGYVTYEEVEAGKDTYYDRMTDSMVKYNYTNIYFIKFVEKKEDNSKNIML